MSDKPHTIDLIVDGKLIGSRTWRNVPRVGDLILIYDNNSTCEVKSVIWSEPGRDAIIYDAWIQLICKTVEHVVAKQKAKKRNKP